MSNPAQDPILSLQIRLANYQEEVQRLRAHNKNLTVELDESKSIMVDLLETGEKLATQLENQQAMPDSHNGWWIPSFATARVWLKIPKKTP